MVRDQWIGLGLVMLALSALPSCLDAVEVVTSGNLTLTADVTAAGRQIHVALDGAPGYRVPEPLSVSIVQGDGTRRQITGGYATLARQGEAVQGRGELHTPGGSTFRFTDTYTAGPVADSVVLARAVAVVPGTTTDAGFQTRFGIREDAPVPLRDHDYFIPGILYRDNHDAQAQALAANLGDDYLLVREDRMALPLVMMRRVRDGATLALAHLAPDGSTCVADYAGGRVIDARIQVASLGVHAQAAPTVAFWYPGSEGQRTYCPGADGSVDPGHRWAERFHPVRADVPHAYRLLITLARHADFPRAMRATWRTAYAQIAPPVLATDLRAATAASMKLVTDWTIERNGCPGIPFRLKLPRGDLENDSDINYQMGFVGQQLPLAFLVLRQGLVAHEEQLVRRGEGVVDFWSARALTAEGLPRTWFDVFPQPHWRAYNTFLRVASDGLAGALRAWEVMRSHGRAKPGWLRFCRGFGDWLVAHQQADGSWCREYAWDGRIADEGRLNTTHPIPFLLALAAATGEGSYRSAALRAGDFCWSHVHQAFAYVGGTPDNPNVIDKEAGALALDAFLALHEATKEPRWLEAACQAADFTETWQYSWRIAVPADDPASRFPKAASSTGFSLIATGHSGADLFLAGAAFPYYRLFRLSGDAHYGDMARRFLYDTKSAVDVGGSLGYGHVGLCPEAISLAVPRGRGVDMWLPWLSYAMLDPVARLEDTYGITDIAPPKR